MPCSAYSVRRVHQQAQGGTRNGANARQNLNHQAVANYLDEDES
jgi:hypothetical protein